MTRKCLKLQSISREIRENILTIKQEKECYGKEKKKSKNKKDRQEVNLLSF